jgi:signal transduction histidine kinase
MEGRSLIHKPKNLIVYLLLALSWPLMAAWLVFEHNGVRRLSEEALLNRARDISNTVAVVSRSGRFGVIRQSRLENALNELAESRELISVALINAVGEIVVQSGQPLQLNLGEQPHQNIRWETDRVIVINPVDFGAVDEDGGTTRTPTIIIPSENPTSPTQRIFPFPGPSDRRPRPPDEDGRDGRHTAPDRDDRRPPPDREDRRGGDDDFDRRDGRRDRPDDKATMETEETERREASRDGRRRGDRSRIFQRPPWLSQEQYDTLLRKQGLHGFVVVLSTDAVRAETGRDFWLRIFLGGIGLLAVIGLAQAWRSMERSTRLQMRLLRAHEMNTHLQEMNLAAAGLAHETRNPLNIVRGLAQMIAQRPDIATDIRERSRDITDEVDRVTSRLNEFINYSRPPEPRPAATRLKTVVDDVARTLESDFADKSLHFEFSGPDIAVMADESLLRQVLFNLLMNAIQAVPAGGRVRIVVATPPGSEAELIVEDDGPGVAEEIREEIFRPYFTTNAQGSGLGLAVVNQIVLAHRWEIGYVRSQMGGAGFRISGMKTH